MARTYSKKGRKSIRSAKRKVPRRKTATKSKFAKSVRKIAKAVVHKAAENQIIVTALQVTNPTIGPTAPQNVAPNPLTAAPGTGFVPGSGLFTGAITTYLGGTVNSLIPIITQGSGQGARKSNRISPRSFTIRGVVTSNYASFTQVPANRWVEAANPKLAPFYVHMIIWTRKDSLQSIDVSRLLQGGTAPGTAVPIDGHLLTSTYPFNRDAYNVYKHRVFKMANEPVLVSDLSTPPANTYQWLDDGYGNGFKMSHMFKYNLPIGKVWKYDDSIISGVTPANTPTNCNYWISWYVVNADDTLNGGIYDAESGSGLESRVNIQMETVLSYEDF